MKESNNSNVSIQVQGKMSETDVGHISRINAWRELIRDTGTTLLKIIVGGISAWQGGEILKTAIPVIFS